MNVMQTTTQPLSEPAPTVGASVRDLDRRRVNAEQTAQFALDDLTEARAQLAAKVRRYDELAAKMGEAREMIRQGRTALAGALLADLITVARLEGTP